MLFMMCFFHKWGLKPTRLLCPWDSPGKNTGVGSLSLLQGIFLTQESNRGLLHCRQILYQLSYQGSPKENEIMPLAAMWMDPEITKLSEVSQKEKDKIPLLLFSH